MSRLSKYNVVSVVTTTAVLLLSESVWWILDTFFFSSSSGSSRWQTGVTAALIDNPDAVDRDGTRPKISCNLPQIGRPAGWQAGRQAGRRWGE